MENGSKTYGLSADGQGSQWITSYADPTRYCQGSISHAVGWDLERATQLASLIGIATGMVGYWLPTALQPATDAVVEEVPLAVLKEKKSK